MTGFFPKGLQFGYEAIVSFKRIQEFLLIEEVDSSNANIKSLEEIWPEITEARRMREEEKKKKSGEDEKAGAAAAAAVVDITDNQNQTVIKITDSSTPNASTTLSSDFSNKDVLCVLASASFHWFTQHLNSPAQQQLHRKNNGTGPNLDILEGVNLTLERGKLVGVCGAVGSGKSSLANALLGELQMSSSSVGGGGGLMAFQKSITTSSTSTNKRKLKVAYSPQSAYIIAGSIKSNILFGSEFDEAWFWAVVKACRLDQDVSKMPEGVDTIVGERGITLSGGQKARLQLARAVYFDADIYILDDPLSALDTKVGRRLFDQCIKGNLLSLDPIHGHRSQPAAVLLITHQLQFIKECDEIRIISNGRLQDPIFKSNFHQESEHEEILQKAVSALSLNNTGGDGCTNRFSAPSLPNTNNDAASSPQFVKNVAADSDEAIAAITLAKRDHIKENIEKIKSMEEEKKKKKLELESSAILKKGGKMTKKSSLAYLADFFISGSTLFTQSLLFIGLLGGQAIMNTGSWWLSSWSKESPADQLANGRFNALVYLGFVLAVVIVGVLRAVLFFSICKTKTSCGSCE